ncbi:hypothetical protein TEA_017053 [Camellia sinensis var. sinensis]|uniref:O-fucosyltransferase family protein n=1 Tax=Camellia sinensis var. sinensis TaxID=542762 RepID=A0A4S4DZY5_CAMSN|nr:hypothetical protein TEA_017053 [Camellia sinensis var. sinensis]
MIRLKERKEERKRKKKEKEERKERKKEEMVEAKKVFDNEKKEWGIKVKLRGLSSEPNLLKRKPMNIELLSKEWKDYFWEFIEVWHHNEDADSQTAKDCLKKIVKYGQSLLSEPLASLFEFSLTLRSTSPRLVLYRQLAVESLSSFPLYDDINSQSVNGGIPETNENVESKKVEPLLVGMNPRSPGGECCWVDTGGAFFFDVSEFQTWLHSPKESYPLNAKAAHCQACYNTICLTRALAKKGSELLQAIPKPFLSLHLRFEPDMVAYSQCNYSGLSSTSMEAIEAAQGDRKPWTGEAARVWRNRGKCPLTPKETAFILQALSIPKNTNIYLAAGDGLMELGGLTFLRDLSPWIWNYSSSSIRARALDSSSLSYSVIVLRFFFWLVIHLGIAIWKFHFEHSAVIYLCGFETLSLLRSENELKARWDVDKSMLEESKNVAENKYNEINEQSKGYKEVKSIGASIDQSIDVAGICNEAATLDQEDMVIDESNSGEPWVQGLMEGEYSDLSVEERLSAVVALIGVTNEGNSIRIVLDECLEAANALKKQMWAEVQLDKCRMKEEAGKAHCLLLMTNNLVSTNPVEQKEHLHDAQNDPNYPIHRPSKRNPQIQEVSTCTDNLSLLQPGYAAERSWSQLKSYIGHKAEEMYVYRSLPLGQDRRRNRYWQFITSSSRNDPGSGRIFVELRHGCWRLIDSEELAARLGSPESLQQLNPVANPTTLFAVFVRKDNTRQPTEQKVIRNIGSKNAADRMDKNKNRTDLLAAGRKKVFLDPFDVNFNLTQNFLLQAMSLNCYLHFFVCPSDEKSRDAFACGRQIQSLPQRHFLNQVPGMVGTLPDALCMPNHHYSSNCNDNDTSEGTNKFLKTIPRYVKIVEVGPRDGLQNEKEIVPPSIKIELIKMLVSSGLPVVEATSFVSPKWVPQLADAKDVLEAIQCVEELGFLVLRQLLHGAKEVAIFAAASESFSMSNINCSIEDSLARYRDVALAAKKLSIPVLWDYCHLQAIQVCADYAYNSCPVSSDILI